MREISKMEKREGKGIMYDSNGNREMADFKNGKGVGVSAVLTKDGEVFSRNY